MTAAAILEPACPPGVDPTLPATLPFEPDKRTLHAILQRLVSPDYDLADIAACFRITLMDLMDWLERPDVVQLVTRLERHIRRKARLAARASAPLVIRTLRRTLSAFQREDDAEIARPPADRPAHADPRDRDRVIRTREAVRKAAALLERMAKAPARYRPRAKPRSERPVSAPSTQTSREPASPNHAQKESTAAHRPSEQDSERTPSSAPSPHASHAPIPTHALTPAPDPENPDTAPT